MDRFTIPRLMAPKFFFEKAEQRKEAFLDLLNNWHMVYTFQGDRTKASLISLPAAPGMGKTRFAQVAAARGLREDGCREPEWDQALQDFTDEHFKESIAGAVGVTVTFNSDTPLQQNEQYAYMIGVRMLHSHFCRETHFGVFLKWLESCKCGEIWPDHAIQLIQYDMLQNGRADGHIILVIDEVLVTVANENDAKQRTKLLGLVCSSLSRIVTEHNNVHILVTSLSYKELRDSCTPASGRPVLFLDGFHPLDGNSIMRLIQQAPQTARQNLQQLPFQAVLRESLGIPRLLEYIFRVAETLVLEDGTATDVIRHKVQVAFSAKGKYADVGYCSDSIFAAFSTYRGHSPARETRTKLAEREGYLFKAGSDFQVPPLLLRWWRGFLEQSGDINAMALVRAANNIISQSDIPDGPEHAHRWERQLAHLWRILMITNKMWRAENEIRSRTLLGQLGSGSKIHDIVLASVAPDVAKLAVFNCELEEFTSEESTLDFGTIEQPQSGATDLPPNMGYGRIYFPADRSNPGFDFAVADQKKLRNGQEPEDVITLVEAKFSAPGSTTQLTKKDIKEKFNLMLKGRPTVQKAFLEKRLCYVIGGLRNPQVQAVVKDMPGLIDEIANNISSFNESASSFEEKRSLVSRCLVILSREHVLGLLTPSLASLPPFAEVVLKPDSSGSWFSISSSFIVSIPLEDCSQQEIELMRHGLREAHECYARPMNASYLLTER